MSLEAAYQQVTTRKDEILPHSWTIRVSQEPWEAVVLDGFASKRDAELAIEALNETEINWDGSAEQIKSQAEALGINTKCKLMKIACENLRW